MAGHAPARFVFRLFESIVADLFAQDTGQPTDGNSPVQAVGRKPISPNARDHSVSVCVCVCVCICICIDDRLPRPFRIAIVE